jgi:hypothetical protein
MGSEAFRRSRVTIGEENLGLKLSIPEWLNPTCIVSVL